MITGHAEGSLSSTVDEKSESYEASSQVNTYDHPPPLYTPPRYSSHNYPPLTNSSAGQAYGTDQNGQPRWQSANFERSSSSSSQHLPPAPSREHFSPNASSSSFSAPSGSDSGSNRKPKRDPMNPPPPSFFRPVSPYHSLPSFPSLTIYSKKRALSKGFPIAFPMPLHPVLDPQQQQDLIHPFSQRDVLIEDWTRFLEDIHITAQLSTEQKIGLVAAHTVPLIAGLPIIGGLLVSQVVHKRMKKKRVVLVANLVDTWNQYFFHKRGLHVILARGPENISVGVDGPAPDWDGSVQAGKAGSDDCDSDSSSSTDSDSEEDDSDLDSESAQDKKGTSPTPSRRERRKARRAQRRGKKKERKARRTAHKHYRLVVVPVQVTS